MPYLFVSYARADADYDDHLDRFYRDLCHEVRGRTGLPFEEIGFRDQENLLLGEDWSPALAEAIVSSRVFIALCSPSYFLSEMCGKEWQMFAELINARRAASTVRPSNLLPITWIPTRDAPAVARRLQHAHADLGEVYKREGLHFLARFKRYREDDYQAFVVRLAQRITDVAGPHPPPPPPAMPDFATTPNAFRTGPSATAADRARVEFHALGDSLPAPPPEPAPRGPHHVTFVIAAAALHEIEREKIRHVTHYYGARPFNWSPYRPGCPDWISVSAQGVAVAKGMISALTEALTDTSIVDRLAEAREQNEVLVLIVDVWATQLESYFAVFVDYDGHNTSTSPIVVPWNEEDDELQSRSTELERALSQAFSNNSTRRDVFQKDLPTIEAFRLQLEKALTLAQSEIFRSGPVARRAGGVPPIERPIITPPSQGAHQ